MSRFIVAIGAMSLLTAVPAAGWAQPAPGAYCRRIGTDDTLRSIPPSLVPAVAQLFDLTAMPPSLLSRSTYFRCADRRVLVCTVGANLVCGKADTRRDLAAVANWCGEHAGAANVPAYVSGHATIYQWRCDGARPVATPSLLHVDARGFIAQNWKTLGSE